MTLHMINYARGGNTWLTILSYLMIRTQTRILHQINPYKIQKNKIKYVRPWQQPGDKYFKCWHGSRKVLTITKRMKFSLNGMSLFFCHISLFTYIFLGLIGHLKTHFPIMYRLFGYLKDKDTLPTQKEIAMAQGKTVLDAETMDTYLASLEFQSNNLIKAFQRQSLKPEVCHRCHSLLLFTVNINFRASLLKTNSKISSHSGWQLRTNHSTLLRVPNSKNFFNMSTAAKHHPRFLVVNLSNATSWSLERTQWHLWKEWLR